MIEIKGDLWKVEADARVITTNGSINRHGEAVMGRGCAFQAAERYPNLKRWLASRINRYGNRVRVYLEALEIEGDKTLVMFPVKHEWYQKADPDLIVLSAQQLVEKAMAFGWQRVVMPRPGCGNGRLKWEDVKSLLAPILDDRFIVISYESED